MSGGKRFANFEVAYDLLGPSAIQAKSFSVRGIGWICFGGHGERGGKYRKGTI
jgi:hypothetical protein